VASYPVSIHRDDVTASITLAYPFERGLWLLDIGQGTDHSEPMVDRRVPSPVQQELLWRCTECDYEVDSIDQPEPCGDHPFDRMKQVKD
jgi:hypothetical protein